MLLSKLVLLSTDTNLLNLESVDLITVSLVFCVFKFIISYLQHIKSNACTFITFQSKVNLVLIITMVILASYLFYNSRKLLPGNLTDTSIKNDDPGLEFIRVIIWQLYLVSHIF
jgi:hypothetical protein